MARAEAHPELGRAVEEAARQHNIVVDDALVEAAKVAKKRTRTTVLIIGIGVAWSFLFTSISLVLMLGMSNQANEVCRQFSESREIVRSLILSDPEFEKNTVDLVSEAMPPIEC